jgi:hypothetical protein
LTAGGGARQRLFLQAADRNFQSRNALLAGDRGFGSGSDRPDERLKLRA